MPTLAPAVGLVSAEAAVVQVVKVKAASVEFAKAVADMTTAVEGLGS